MAINVIFATGRQAWRCYCLVTPPPAVQAACANAQARRSSGDGTRACAAGVLTVYLADAEPKHTQVAVISVTPACLQLLYGNIKCVCSHMPEATTNAKHHDPAAHRQWSDNSRDPAPRTTNEKHGLFDIDPQLAHVKICEADRCVQVRCVWCVRGCHCTQ